MFKIHGIRELDALDEDAFASILLCHEIDAATVDLFSNSFNSLNERLGHDWHLCLPGYSPFSTIEPVFSDEYDYAKAVAYVRHSQLPINASPCIAFIFGPKTPDREHYLAQYIIGTHCVLS